MQPAPCSALSQAEKVNLAFPVAEDLVTAQNSFFSSLEEGSPKSVLTGQYAALLKIRGLTCSGTASIGFFDTNAVIKTKISDTACFKDQDAKLAEMDRHTTLCCCTAEASAHSLVTAAKQSGYCDP
jgi:hypothetical protein